MCIRDRSHGAPGLVDLCLANSAPVRPGLVEKYREEDAAPILVDRERIRAMGLELEEYPVASEGGDYARHDPDRLAAAVLDLSLIHISPSASAARPD